MKSNSGENAEKVCQAFGSIDTGKLISVNEGILTGGGGCFTQRFTDFIIGTMGETLLNHYIIDLGTGNPADVQSVRLLKNRADGYARLMKMVLDIGFFKIELNPSHDQMVRHTAVAHPKYGVHRMIWAKNGLPTPPEELVKFGQEIRHFLDEGFKEEFWD